MANTLIGFGSPDGLGSSCGCQGARRAGMGAGPDGLGADPEGKLVGAGLGVFGLMVLTGAAISGGLGYIVGGAIGQRSKYGKVATGAAAGAATAALATVAMKLLARPRPSAESTATPTVKA